MAQTNRERLTGAFDILSEGLKPFIEREMRATYRERWHEEIIRSLISHQRARIRPDELPEDSQALIQILEAQWDQVFKAVLGPKKHYMVDELRDTRNKWAHQEPFSTDDAWRAYDSIQRFLTVISALSSASQSRIEREKDELRRIRFEELSHPGINKREAEIRLSTEVLWKSKRLKLSEQLITFTDRRKALALFDLIAAHDSGQPFPILAFVAYGGSGKSTLIDYLRTKKCYSTNGQALFPYAHINFTDDTSETPKDLLKILIELRDQLQLHRDEEGKHLVFPRFDLTASIALSVPKDGLPRMDNDQITQWLKSDLRYLGLHGNMDRFLGDYRNLIQALLSGILQDAQIPELQLVLQLLEESPGWRWYLQQNSDLDPNANISRVLFHLYISCRSTYSGRSGLDDLIKQQLPKAFFADLKDAIGKFVRPQGRGEKTKAIVFLDGFEALMKILDAKGLLEMLSINQFENEEVAPFLLVVGSRHELLELTETERRFQQDDEDMENTASALYSRWQENLPKMKHGLSLENLLLPLNLSNFGLDDTRVYLQRFSGKYDTQIFVDEALVQAIHDVTQGYPLYVDLVAVAAWKAEGNGKPLRPEEIREAIRSKRIDRDLLHLLLREMEEQKAELIACSAPRSLDIATLRAIQPKIKNDLDAEERLNSYCRVTLLSKGVSDGKYVFHSVVREILQQGLRIRVDPKSDYYLTHASLLEHFHDGDEQASLEEAYHALALGNPDPIIKLGIAAQQGGSIPWGNILEVVVQAPTELVPANIEARADEALQRLHLYNFQDGVTAAILYTWLLTVSEKEPTKVADRQHALGFAYTRLSRGDRQANLERAIRCYESTLATYTKEDFPFKWAVVQTDLSEAYCLLPGEDQYINWQKAVECCEYALQILTQENHPFEWATAQNNLGEAYSHSSGSNRRAYLEKAIICYKAALTVRTRENRPFDRGVLQNNLGNAYCNLRGEANLLQAVQFYKEALVVRTYEQYPVSWATTKNNLGNAYRNLGDEKNLRAAIECYQEALKVRTRESLPYEWAMTQNNLGLTCHNLPQGKDRQANLWEAIQHYEDALTVRTRESYPYDWAATQNNLGLAYQNLQGKDRQANLREAIQHYEAALTVYTRGKFQSDWAKMQNNIGNTYRDLGEGANLLKAIEHYEAALTVYTREDFPYDWAATQNNLGLAYRKLQDEASLRKAITYYEAALSIRTREAALVARAKTLKNLGDVYSEFQGKNRRENLSRAIKHYEEARNIFLSKQMRNDVGSINKKLREIREEL